MIAALTFGAMRLEAKLNI